jgi:hypothetical protein
MYDLIGDIHGHADKLVELLQKLDYKKTQGVWQHSTRQAIFLGDYVDRGPKQVETVTIVKDMVEQGAALAIMGNHEYNAVAWASEDPRAPGEALRRHNEKHYNQHKEFLNQVGEHSPAHKAFIAWFKTLPVYLELPELRAIHACWHAPFLQVVQPYLDDNNALLPHAWEAGARQGTEFCSALETLLKGLEIKLPDGHSFYDKDGNERTEVRTKWWFTGEKTYRNLALMPQKNLDQLPEVPVQGDIPAYDQTKPVFVGHYWLTGEPAPLSDTIACLDYSVAGQKGGKLCAYRLGDEQTLQQENFVYV